ncbi:ribonuclease HII [Brachybacterium sp. ACRRE]|uniref:ribonuclease HII n=1 Tax=Brachybacterium sp. ACRRE TaxID=2918184 RepID=UPI001EF3B420|nr:ribonuclease HII [Brachybacterium sp. ACRRE]
MTAPASSTAGRRRASAPTWDTEIALALAHADAAHPAPHGDAAADPARPVVIAGVDEVGRGALAGPVVVGAFAVLIGADGPEHALPEGVRDSKALTARRREALVGPLREVAHAHALGWASPEEIDARGILAALSLAAGRAIAGLGVAADIVLMDGDADVITPALAAQGPGSADGWEAGHPLPSVHLRVKADRDCMSVAAASVLAKVARDAHMVDLDALAPHYGWAGNQGYGSAAHREALRTRGAHAQHRRSWNLGLPVSGAANVQETPGVPGVLWSDAGEQPRPRIPKEAQP